MRLFIGIALPDNVRDMIDADVNQLRKSIPGRYVSKDNYHITLAPPPEENLLVYLKDHFR